MNLSTWLTPYIKFALKLLTDLNIRAKTVVFRIRKQRRKPVLPNKAKDPPARMQNLQILEENNDH